MSSFQPWANPDPQSVAGLNSSMVYGENIQTAVGLNHQIAIGSNLQLCINPFALIDMANLQGGSTLSGFFGSGLGGNLQFTLGSNTAVTWGRQFAFDLGPDHISADGTQWRPFMIVLCCLIGAAAMAYPIAYGLEGDEDNRATIVIMFQILMDLLLAALVVQLTSYQKIDEKSSDGLKELFDAPGTPHTSVGSSFLQALEFVAALSALITPVVLIAREEGHFQGEKPQADS